MARIWRFRLHGFYNGTQDVVHTLHFQTDVPVLGSEPSAATVLSELENHFNDSSVPFSVFRNTAPTNCVYDEASVEEVLPPGSTDAPLGSRNTHALAGIRSVGDGKVPQPACGYWLLRTDKLGRSFRGGVHTAPIIASAALDASGMISLASTWGSFFDAGTAKLKDSLEDVFSSTGDINAVIYSRTRHARGLSHTEKITDCVASTRPRFLRTRDVNR